MKKNDWILATAVGLYSFLFYEQAAGINFVIFNIALILGLAVRDNNVLKNNKWRLAAVGSLFSSFCIGYYANALSVTANILSLSLLSGLTLSSKSSVILSILFSFYSYFSSPVFMLLDKIEKRKNEIVSSSSPFFKRTLLIVIPILITLLFFFMYKESNPLFNDFSKNINFDFISFNWITFTLGGFILLYGFFYHRKIKFLSDIDENASNELVSGNSASIKLFGKELNIDDENFSGKIVFILLNALLLIVNLLDINFLFIDGKLPKGVTYSEFVHQGVGMLITSIIIAVAIILFYFRDALNFYEKNKTIRFLAYFWIIQNAFMLLSTALRNGMYIGEYGLTYKRIGVYVYLVLTLIGLLTAFIKIVKLKTNNYLFRTNGWLFYSVLVLACFFNWDRMITNFNIHDAKKLEKNYLLQLSYANLPQLFILQHDTTIHHQEFTLKEKQGLYEEELASGPEYQTSDFDERLSGALYYFLSDRETLNWRSWYYENARIHNDLIQLNNANKIKKLKLSSMGIKSLEQLKEFNNLDELQLGSNNINDAKVFSHFPLLKKLDLRDNKIIMINGLEVLHHLEYLDISKNPISNYFPLYNLKKLKELRIGNITPIQLEALQKNLPTTKIVTG